METEEKELTELSLEELEELSKLTNAIYEEILALEEKDGEEK